MLNKKEPFQVRVPRGVQVRVLFWALSFLVSGYFGVGEVAELVDALL